MEQIIKAIEKELKWAAEHPEKGNFNSPHKGYAVIKEELEELWDAIKQNRIQGACDESIRVAAMSIQFVLNFGKKTKEGNLKAAAIKAARTGNREDLYEYLKLRRGNL